MLGDGFSIPYFLAAVFGISALWVYVYAWNKELKFKELKKEFVDRQRILQDRIYEITILQKVGEKIGYSLDVQKICDILLGSLSNVFDYSVASYLIFDSNHIKIHHNIQNPVSERYLKELKKRMLESFYHLSKNPELVKVEISETSFGALPVNERVEGSVNLESYFHIPIIVENRTVALVTVSSNQKNIFARENKIDLLYKIAEKSAETVTKIKEVLNTESGKREAMVRNMPDGIIMVDDKLSINLLNPTVYKMLELEENQRYNVLDLAEKFEPKIKLDEEFKKVLNLNKHAGLNEVLVNGIYLSIDIHPIVNKEEVIGAFAVLHDITEEKRLEKLKEDFTSMMVHELRSPLSVIYGTSDTLVKRIKELNDEKVAELLFGMKNSSKSMLDIVNDLLDTAKIESGKFEVNKTTSNLKNLIKTQVTYYKTLAERDGLQLNLSYARGTPEEVNMDSQRISQVLNNLISNAIKYSKEGAISVKVEPKNKDKSVVLVSITDNGIGMDEESQKKIFTKFQQVRNPVDPKQKGTGLGLVVAKGIVESHGGEMGVKSKIGEGSTFWFTLPVR